MEKLAAKTLVVHVDHPHRNIASIHVLVMEQHMLVCTALVQTIATLPNIEAVGVANISRASSLLQVKTPDVVLLSTSTSLKECLQITELVKQKYPRTGIVAFIASVCPATARLLMKSGVHALLDEAATAKDLEIALQASAMGHAFHSHYILEKITSPGRNGQLTEAEIRILSFLMQGKSNSAIAQKLHVTTKTVEAHLTRIYRKLGVNSRSQAAVEAQKHHLYLDSKPVLLEEAY